MSNTARNCEKFVAKVNCFTSRNAQPPHHSAPGINGLNMPTSKGAENCGRGIIVSTQEIGVSHAASIPVE
jgi:hypothetical protein